MPMPDTSKKAIVAIQTAIKVLQRDAATLKGMKLTAEAQAIQTMVTSIEKSVQAGLKATGST
jgi:chemotaxis protein histidine kinase CheA